MWFSKKERIPENFTEDKLKARLKSMLKMLRQESEAFLLKLR